MYINPYEKSLGGFDIFTYRVKFDENYEDNIFFTPFNIEEEKKYIDSNGKYKIRLQQNVIGLDCLKKYDIRDCIWLEKKINSFTKFQTLHQFYDKMYIVQKDSIHNKAILTEVINIEIAN